MGSYWSRLSRKPSQVYVVKAWWVSLQPTQVEHGHRRRHGEGPFSHGGGGVAAVPLAHAVGHLDLEKDHNGDKQSFFQSFKYLAKKAYKSVAPLTFAVPVLLKHVLPSRPGSLGSQPQPRITLVTPSTETSYRPELNHAFNLLFYDRIAGLSVVR